MSIYKISNARTKLIGEPPKTYKKLHEAQKKLIENIPTLKKVLIVVLTKTVITYKHKSTASVFM